MSTNYGYLVVDNRHYNCLPKSFLPIDDFVVRGHSYAIMDGKQMVVVESAQTKTTNDYTQKRRVQIQAWAASWETGGTHATVQLRNQLYDIYNTQKEVWIQLDDEMAREWARLVPVGHELLQTDKPKAYFTPTYPIYPYGYVSGDTIDWTEHLLVASDYYRDPFTVDSNTGLILIAPSRIIFTSQTKVHMKYTWRAKVRIAELLLEPTSIDQQYYVGHALFEQVV